MPKITTKPTEAFRTHNVFVDGEMVAEVYFNRFVGRYHCSTSGYFKNLKSGKTMRIDHMAYFKDVVRYIPVFLEQTA